MVQYKEYRYADSQRLNAKDHKLQESQASQEERLAREEELRQQLEAGEITEAEYNTLSTSTSSGATAPALEIPNLAPTYHIDESAITDSLTEEDIQYLMLK